MMEKVEHVAKQSATDCLIKAMENADDIEHVLILTIRKGELPVKFFTDAEQTIAETVWMIEAFKLWLMASEH